MQLYSCTLPPMFDRCLYFNTNHLARTIGKIWQDAFSELGLAPAHAYLLRLVIEQPGMVQKDIATELHLEKSTITRFVDKMVEQDYLIRKMADSGNNREQQIHPTSKAIKLGVKLQEIGNSLYQKMTESIGEKELKKLVKTIRNTTDKLAPS